MTTPLERNDRYVLEFVEAFNLCPFARRCRETGKLHRRVLGKEDSLLEQVRAVEALQDVEVGLLICPEATGDAREWEQTVARLRDQLGPTPKFFCVAFHPGLQRDLATAGRAVHFIRRSPDPTIQLVNAAVLKAVRAGHEGGSKFVDPSKLTVAELMALSSPLDLGDRIAEENLQTLLRAGPDRLEALLASMRPK